MMVERMFLSPFFSFCSGRAINLKSESLIPPEKCSSFVWLAVSTEETGEPVGFRVSDEAMISCEPAGFLLQMLIVQTQHKRKGFSQGRKPGSWSARYGCWPWSPGTASVRLILGLQIFHQVKKIYSLCWSSPPKKPITYRVLGQICHHDII